MARRFLLGIAAALAFLAVPSVGESCTCMRSPICETFWKTPVVFAGEVSDITVKPRAGQADPFADRRVRFKVDRVWRGNLSDTVDIMTGGGGGDCGYPFRPGERYLVFTSERDGALWTGICHRTKPLSAAREDLEYLNQPLVPQAGGRIFGEVHHAPLDPRDPPSPARHYTVSLRDDSRQWTAVTNARGLYEFNGIPAGTYHIALTLPATERAYGRQNVELADPRGCAAADFTIERPRVVIASRTLRGQVVWPDGRPAAGASVYVELANGSRPGTTTWSDAEGRFEFVVQDGSTYRLIVALNDASPDRLQWSVVSGDIAVGGDVDPIRLVLQRPR